MLDLLLTVVGVLALLVAALAGRLERLPVTGPLLGLVTGVVLGPAVLGAVDLPTVMEGHRELHEVSRILLAISVMAVALRYPLRAVRRLVKPVVLLLTVAMLGMALLSTAVAAVVLGAGLTAAVLLGAALCPTDPVLASSAVTGEKAERTVSERTRQLLSLESGGNDGLAMPLVLAAVAIAGASSGRDVLLESLWQTLGAVAFGAAAGWVGGRILRKSEERGATEHGPVLVFSLLLALFVLGAAGLLGVDDILAVFVAGLAFNGGSSADERASDAQIDEAINTFVVLPLFVVLGAMLPWEEWGELGWQGPVLVLGVLFLRRLPVLLLLKRPLSLEWRDAFFLGWFGPVGVAALFYLTLEADRLGVDPLVLSAGTLVVAASTLAHGVTTVPGLVLYRRAAGRRKGGDSGAGARP
ncbi:cation:proton antiporter [Streptomyces sp. ACA25]|uniref:cation:proton antiporter domain-containing protein n=1 Tax=Streptomyces sp. ACA25 TaxID=3022596 RepID=UPI002307AD48|nr:cation:proton antiporter [Streptomyces sp. ACA25]MDB1087689.1 cation:proton antiporter [Streptomyces sp. ACA25]